MVVTPVTTVPLVGERDVDGLTEVEGERASCCEHPEDIDVGEANGRSDEEAVVDEVLGGRLAGDRVGPVDRS